MNDDERAQQAMGHMLSIEVEMALAAHNLRQATQGAGRAIEALVSTYQLGIDRELAGHPDIAELNVMLDGFYGNGSPSPEIEAS